MVGCLSMLGLAALVLAAEWWATGMLQLPHRPWLAGVLAVLATLALSSPWGVAQARRQRAAPQDGLERWQDGATVRVEGLLQSAAAPVLAPFSGQPAVYLSYEARPSVARTVVESGWRARWSGQVAVPAVLHTPVGLVPLHGMPREQHWPRQVFEGEAAHARAAWHLAATPWEQAPEVVEAAGLGMQDLWPQPGPDGAAQRHLMSRGAADTLGMQDGGRTDESLRERLAARTWTYEEHLLAPGARVTVVGTYRASPRGIEVGLSLRHPDQGVYPGTAAALAQGHWRASLVGATVLIALAVVAHGWVYGDGGVRLRGLLNSLEGMG